MDTFFALDDGRLRLIERGLELIEPLKGDFLFELRGNHFVLAAELGQTLLGGSQSLPVFLGFLLEEVECAGWAMDSHVLFQIKIRQGGKHSGGELVSTRSI